MTELSDLLHTVCNTALNYRDTLTDRSITPELSYDDMRALLDEPLPETGSDGSEVIRELAAKGDRGLMQMAHPRFFGWVLGASHPVGVAADWLASAWGQNTGYHTPTPATSAIEELAGRWLLDILDLPRAASVGFVTGATVGNFTALAAARGKVLRDHGWDADADGLFGAPPIDVYIGDDAHTSVFSALQYLGLGHARVIRIDADADGRMEARDLDRKFAKGSGPAIVIAQAGQINTGAFDPFADIAEIAKTRNAWVHVDGAFGLWARANADLKPLTDGIEGADSWVTDGHKWLQTPFDTGYAIVRDAESHYRAMTTWASYLPTRGDEDRIPSSLTPELSRRARGLPTWAILKTMGRQGVSDMIARHCAVARHIAARLSQSNDIRILNDVHLNQVIVGFGPEDAPDETRKALSEAVIDEAVASGQLFVGGARWRDDWVMRISVISRETSMEDADIATDAILAAWETVKARQAG